MAAQGTSTTETGGGPGNGALPPFERIVADYGPLISRIAMSYEADPSLREDLTQQIFLAVWQALPSYRADASLKTFIARVAQNRSISFVTKQVRQPRARRTARTHRSRRPQSRGKRDRSQRARDAAGRDPPAAAAAARKSSSSSWKVLLIRKLREMLEYRAQCFGAHDCPAPRPRSRIDAGAERMSDFDLDRLGDVWRQQPDPAEMERLQRSAAAVAPARAVRAGRRHRRGGRGRGVVIFLVACNPSTGTFLMGGGAILSCWAATSASAGCARSSCSSLTGSTEDMLDQSIERVETTLQHHRFSSDRRGSGHPGRRAASARSVAADRMLNSGAARHALVPRRADAVGAFAALVGARPSSCCLPSAAAGASWSGSARCARPIARSANPRAH